MKNLIKILVIDKEEIILKSVKKALKNNDHTEFVITTCNTALEGLKLIRTDKFDLALIDPILPGMNGNELIRRIKNIYQDMPIIIMSGYSSVGTNQFEFVTGQNGFSKPTVDILKKPFTTEEINSVIGKTLRNYLNIN